MTNQFVAPSRATPGKQQDGNTGYAVKTCATYPELSTAFRCPMVWVAKAAPISWLWPPYGSAGAERLGRGKAAFRLTTEEKGHQTFSSWLGKAGKGVADSVSAPKKAAVLIFPRNQIENTGNGILIDLYAG